MKILGVSVSTIIVIGVVYLIGARFPQLARKVGL